MEISSNSTVVVAKNVISCDLVGELALLNLKDGVYYVLDAQGAGIWNLIQKPNTLKDVLEVLLKEYDVDKEQCRQDLMELIQELVDKGLVEIKNGSI
ncbi:MAG TPA: PqqD family peptide modification chaperone [Methanobacterium sp.]